jgi:hypothetical protein
MRSQSEVSISKGWRRKYRQPDHILQQAAASAPSKTSITIDNIEYSLDTSQIPYLSSFVAFKSKARPDATTFIHGPVPLFSIALQGIESGYRHCFRSLPASLTQYHTLCETYEFLGVDVLRGQSLDDIFADVKAGKTEYELEYKYYTAVKGNKAKARDAAFRLLYLLLLGEFQNEHRDAMKMFNAVVFVVSHPGTFKWRTRTVVRMGYEERFVVTEKQRAVLEKWKKSCGTESEEEDDVTTEEDELDDSDFDDDGCYWSDD